jgi:hypothetical protein
MAAPRLVDHRILDFLMFAVSRGSKHWQRLRLDSTGLFAVRPVAAGELLCVVPPHCTLSLLDVAADPYFPLRASPTNFGSPVPFWPEVNWGTFVLTAWLTRRWMEAHGGVSQTLDVVTMHGGSVEGRLYDRALQVTQQTPDYTTTIASVLSSSGRSFPDLRGRQEATEDGERSLESLEHGMEQFNAYFRRVYVTLHRRGLPVWSREGVGAAFFGRSPFGAQEASGGDCLALVPFVASASHSSSPNAAVGCLDSDGVAGLVREGLLPEKYSLFDSLFVLQAQGDIPAGQAISVNRNESFQLPPDAFRSWFGEDL